MAKEMSKDSQILLNMMKVQSKMVDVFDSFDDKKDLIKDENSVNLLTYFLIRLFSMRKNFSGKTKKAIGHFDDEEYNLITRHLVSCFPLISNSEIVDYAEYMCSSEVHESLLEHYGKCVKQSLKYE